MFDCTQFLAVTFQVPENRNLKIGGILVIPKLSGNHTMKAIDNLLGPNLLQGVCGLGSISHSCKSKTGCLLDDGGDSVTIPYLMNNSAITFR